MTLNDIKINHTYNLIGHCQHHDVINAVLMLVEKLLVNVFLFNFSPHVRFFVKVLIETNINTVKPVLRGHPREGQKWLLKTGDPLIQVHLHCILGQGTQKR